MPVRFYCTIDNKENFNSIKTKINLERATIVREVVRDFKNDFHAKLEVVSHGSFLYNDLNSSGICKTLELMLTLKEDE